MTRINLAVVEGDSSFQNLRYGIRRSLGCVSCIDCGPSTAMRSLLRCAVSIRIRFRLVKTQMPKSRYYNPQSHIRSLTIRASLPAKRDHLSSPNTPNWQCESASALWPVVGIEALDAPSPDHK